MAPCNHVQMSFGRRGSRGRRPLPAADADGAADAVSAGAGLGAGSGLGGGVAVDAAAVGLGGGDGLGSAVGAGLVSGVDGPLSAITSPTMRTSTAAAAAAM